MYTKASELRNVLKQIQQLSWNITQFDKKFPIENLTASELEQVIKSYFGFGDELDLIISKFKMKKNEDKNNTNKILE